MKEIIFNGKLTKKIKKNDKEIDVRHINKEYGIWALCVILPIAFCLFQVIFILKSLAMTIIGIINILFIIGEFNTMRKNEIIEYKEKKQEKYKNELKEASTILEKQGIKVNYELLKKSYITKGSINYETRIPTLEKSNDENICFYDLDNQIRILKETKEALFLLNSNEVEDMLNSNSKIMKKLKKIKP